MKKIRLTILLSLSILITACAGHDLNLGDDIGNHAGRDINTVNAGRDFSIEAKTQTKNLETLPTNDNRHSISNQTNANPSTGSPQPGSIASSDCPPTPGRFYIYKDKGCPNKFLGALWANLMPKYADRSNSIINVSPGFDGTGTAVQIEFNLSTNNSWGGGVGLEVPVEEDYWGKTPLDNEADALNLTNAKKLVFWVKGDNVLRGREQRIRVELSHAHKVYYPDSGDTIPTDPYTYTLTNNWECKEIIIPDSSRLTRVITPFTIIADKAANEGSKILFYVDEIYYALSDSDGCANTQASVSQISKLPTELTSATKTTTKPTSALTVTPPEATNSMLIDCNKFVNSSSSSSLSDINKRLEDILKTAGYEGNNYYPIPDGFTLVTQEDDITSIYDKFFSQFREKRRFVFTISSSKYFYPEIINTDIEQQAWNQSGNSFLPPLVGNKKSINTYYSCLASVIIERCSNLIENSCELQKNYKTSIKALIPQVFL